MVFFPAELGQQWALEQKKYPVATVVETDVTPFLKNSVVCPSGGTTFADSYTIVDVATQPVCQEVPTRHDLPQSLRPLLPRRA